MNVTVTNPDSTFTTYGFDPEHKVEVIGFYTKLYWGQKIQGFKATLADGQVVTMGAN